MFSSNALERKRIDCAEIIEKKKKSPGVLEKDHGMSNVFSIPRPRQPSWRGTILEFIYRSLTR